MLQFRDKTGAKNNLVLILHFQLCIKHLRIFIYLSLYKP